MTAARTAETITSLDVFLNSAKPEYLIVRLGALDDRQICNPASIVWTASAPSWAWFDHDKPSFPGQPS